MAATALITGASGLLGSWTMRHWDVPGLEPVPVRSHDHDLLVPGAPAELIESAAPRVVVHLAWCASGSPDYRDSPDNDRWLQATLELLHAASKVGAQLWLTGTVVDEHGGGTDEYTRAKAALRAHVTSAIEAGLVGWLRPYYVFDEEARRPGLVQHALQARDDTGYAVLRSPDSSHDFVHASDVGRAVGTAVSHELTGIVPIGSGRVRRVADLVNALRVSWRPAETTTGVIHAHGESAADISRLLATGWKPSRTEEFFGHE